MSKRIYSPNRGLYQFKVGGNFYTRVGKTDVCLETSSFEQAEKNLTLQNALVSRFGTQAFKFRIAQLFPRFLNDKKRDTRPRTQKGYEAIWERYFEPKLGKVYIGDMNQRTWEAFCEKLPGVSDFQNHRNLMNNFLGWCERKEFILAIPKLKNPKHVRRKRKILPPQHLALIFQRAHGRLLLFCSMALFMGMRCSEIMGLSWSRVDLENRRLLLRDEDVKTGNSSGGRELPINDVVHSLLVQWLRDQQEAKVTSPWVFPHADKPKIHAASTSLMNAWRVCLFHCGFAEKVPTPDAKRKYKLVVQYTWHDLRATFEKYAHKSTDHTDTQREKFAGAAIDVQRKVYVSMDADDLKGLEEVVSIQVPELAKLIASKTVGRNVEGGSRVGKRNITKLTRPAKARG